MCFCFQGDWSEFNQCQSQLGSLYSEGLPGHKPEFIAYRILYHMMTNETAGRPWYPYISNYNDDI